MEATLALVASLAATGFLTDLARDYRGRPRPHLAAWTVAIGMYALATWSLFLGLALGWNPALFKVFYYFGAIVNVPFLALGSAFLVLGRRTAGRLLVAFVALAAVAAVVTVAADFVRPLPEEGLPSGREVFVFWGPRVWAVAANALGTLLLVGAALYTIVRFHRTNRRLVAGNVLIVLGVLFPAGAGTVVAFFGEAGALASSLAAGAVFLWAGYRVATGARRVRSWSPPAAGAPGDPPGSPR